MDECVRLWRISLDQEKGDESLTSLGRSVLFISFRKSSEYPSYRSLTILISITGNSAYSGNPEKSEHGLDQSHDISLTNPKEVLGTCADVQ